jgi:hypothetical protein
MRKSFLFLLFLLVGISIFSTGCWWDDDDNDVVVANPDLNGNVADGYVKDAKVYIYSDASLSNLIGGPVTTEADGSFKVTLSVSEIPDTVFIKTEGGTDMSTEMAAPSLGFVAPKDKVEELKQGSGINVTPLTKLVFKGVISTLTDETNFDYVYTNKLKKAAEKLGWGNSTDKIFKNTVKDSEAASVEAAYLTAYPSKPTIADGNYILTFVGLSAAYLLPQDAATGKSKEYYKIRDIVQDNKVVLQAKINISSRKITTLSAPPGLVFSGEVMGSSFLIFEKAINAGTVEHLTRIAGRMGQLGGFAGHYVKFKPLGDAAGNFTNETTGICVGSLIPIDSNTPITHPTIQNKLEDPKVVTIRSTYSNEKGPRPIGETKFRMKHIDFSTLTMQLSDMTVDRVFSTPADGTVAKLVQPCPFSFEASILFKTDKGLQSLNNKVLFTIETNIVFAKYCHYDKTNATDETVFVIFPVDTNRGVFIHVGKKGVNNLGDVILDTNITTLSPFVTPNTTYTMSYVEAAKSDLDKKRSDLAVTVANLLVPNLTASDFELLTQEVSGAAQTIALRMYNRDNMAFMRDDDGTFFDSGDDHQIFSKVGETGAFSGVQINGFETFTDENHLKEALPIFRVGKLYPVTTIPSFLGEVKFLARVVYTKGGLDKLSNYVVGKIKLHTDGTATVTHHFYNESDTTSTLNWTNDHGIIHLSGSLGTGFGYIDIFWPIDSGEAAYFHSDTGADGVVRVDGVGVSYITQ